MSDGQNADLLFFLETLYVKNFFYGNHSSIKNSNLWHFIVILAWLQTFWFERDQSPQIFLDCSELFCGHDNLKTGLLIYLGKKLTFRNFLNIKKPRRCWKKNWAFDRNLATKWIQFEWNILKNLEHCASDFWNIEQRTFF